MIAGIGAADIKAMTLPEFAAARQAFERFNGMSTGENAPSDADYWAAVADAAPRPSLH